MLRDEKLAHIYHDAKRDAATPPQEKQFVDNLREGVYKSVDTGEVLLT